MEKWQVHRISNFLRCTMEVLKVAVEISDHRDRLSAYFFKVLLLNICASKGMIFLKIRFLNLCLGISIFWNLKWRNWEQHKMGGGCSWERIESLDGVTENKNWEDKNCSASYGFDYMESGLDFFTSWPGPQIWARTKQLQFNCFCPCSEYIKQNFVSNVVFYKGKLKT